MDGEKNGDGGIGPEVRTLDWNEVGLIVANHRLSDTYLDTCDKINIPRSCSVATETPESSADSPSSELSKSTSAGGEECLVSRMWEGWG